MKNKKNSDQDVNFVGVVFDDFIQYYNENIPAGFPHASPKSLEKFRATHPALFKEDNKWTIDKHRKKLMDWLVSHHDK